MRLFPRLRRPIAALAIAAAAAMAAYGLTHWRFLSGTLGQLELMTLDYRQRATAQPPREKSDVVLVLFDSASVEAWPYSVPFPRAALADIIDAVSAGNPRVIGLDVYLERRFPVLEALDGGEERLRGAIQRAGNVVLVAPTQETPEGRAILPPHPYFAEVAAGLGVADLPTPFESVRDALLSAPTSDGPKPGFALALYGRALGLDVERMLSQAQGAGTLAIPALPPEHARMVHGAVQTVPLRFPGPPSRLGHDDGSFVTVPARFAPMVPGLFADKIVLLGSAIHEHDRFRTAFYSHLDGEGQMYGWTQGVEVHAAALHGLLSGDVPRPLSRVATLALLLGLALLVTAGTIGIGIGTGAATAAAAMLVTAGGSVLAYAHGAWEIPIVGSTLALGFGFVGASSYTSLVEGRQRRFIRRAFAQYVPATVVDQISGDPERLRLGGSRQRITVLFSDLVGFTALTEQTAPEELIGYLNQYLNSMAAVVMGQGGTLDKFIGDAVMAFFGAPVPQDDHALRACRAAIGMQQQLRRMNREGGGAALRMRIGLNTGEPVVGNIGGDRRFDYTAVGAAVNLAARLEAAAKTYGVGILVSEHTLAAAGDALPARELDLITVYGSHEPLRIFELLDPETAPPGELLEHYASGLAAYRRRDWTLAEQYFRSAIEIGPDEGPSLLYLQRCARFYESPPPVDWDFVERRSSK